MRRRRATNPMKPNETLVWDEKQNKYIRKRLKKSDIDKAIPEGPLFNFD